MDIQRTKGHSIVFLNYCQNLLHLLTLKIQKLSTEIPVLYATDLGDDYYDEIMLSQMPDRTSGWDERYRMPNEFEGY